MSRSVGIGARALDEREAVHARHLDVDQEQAVAAARAPCRSASSPEAASVHLVAGRLEDALLQHAGGERVVDTRIGSRRGAAGRPSGCAPGARAATRPSRVEHELRVAVRVERSARDDRAGAGASSGSGRSTTRAPCRAGGRRRRAAAALGARPPRPTRDGARSARGGASPSASGSDRNGITWPSYTQRARRRLAAREIAGREAQRRAARRRAESPRSPPPSSTSSASSDASETGTTSSTAVPLPGLRRDARPRRRAARPPRAPRRGRRRARRPR